MRLSAFLGALVMLAGVRGAQAQAAAPAPVHDAPAAVPVVDVTAAPASPASSSSSSSASASVTATAPTAAAEKEDKPTHFYGLGLDFNVGDSTGLYAREEAYQNDWSMEFDPSWRIGKVYFKDVPALKKLSLGARFILSGEFAGTSPVYRNGNVGANTQFQGCSTAAPGAQGGVVDTSDMPYCQGGSDRRADYSDITLKLSDTVYTIPVALIDIKPSLTGTIPVSAESRAAGLITTLQPAVSVSRAFFDKKLTLAAGFAFAKYFEDATSAVYDSRYQPSNDPRNIQLAGNALSHTGLDQFALTGAMLANYTVGGSLDVTYAPTDKLTFMARYLLIKQVSYSPEGCSITLDNNLGIGQADVCKSGQELADRVGATLSQSNQGSQQFWLTGDYQMNDFIDFELALVTVSPQRAPNGSWYQPFISTNSNNFSTFNFSVTLTTEALAAKLLHKS